MIATSTRCTFSSKMVPRAHQHEAFQKSKDADVFALLWEAGTGKTKTMLDTAAHLWAQGKINGVLVLAPNVVHRMWVDEQAPQHLDVPYRAAWHHGGKRVWKAVLDVNPQQAMPLLAVNSEALSFASGVDLCLQALHQWKGKALVIVDEIQMFKTPSSARTRNLWKVGRACSHRRIATGSIITKGYENVYAPFRFLDPNIIDEKTFSAFKVKYCILVGEYDKIVGYRRIPELLLKLEPWSDRRRLRECEDLPPETWMRRPTALGPEQRRVYTELRDLFITELNAGIVLEAQAAVTRVMRLQQILSGFTVVDGEVHALEDTRLHTTLDLVDELDDKCIIWARFTHDLLQLQAGLQQAGVGCALLYGQQTAAERDDDLKRFRADPGCRALLANPAAGGRGLTILEATSTIYHSHTRKYEERVQSAARNMRIGQQHPVVYHDVVATGTIDEQILKGYTTISAMDALLHSDPTAWLRAMLA